VLPGSIRPRPDQGSAIGEVMLGCWWGHTAGFITLPTVGVNDCHGGAAAQTPQEHQLTPLRFTLFGLIFVG